MKALFPVLLTALALACDRAPTPSVPASDNAQVIGRGEGKDEWWRVLPRAAWAELEPIAQSQDWFEVYRVLPGVFAIYEPGQFEEIISYLIVGTERALLFDTGLGIGDMRGVVSELTDLPIVVINSHTHYDHVGGNYAFDTIYGTGLEYTRAHERGRPHAEVAEFVGAGWIWKKTPVGFSPDTFESRPFAISERLADGQLVALGGVELEVLLTPGHAPDSLCLLDRRRLLLFSGDTLYPATLYTHLPGSDFGDYERSAERLASLVSAVDTVLPAHNEPTMPSSELLALRDAFGSMRSDRAGYVLTDGSREYDFGRFSVLVTDPPPWLTE
jgi:glyoxylase-like metal-dependent hydrolase (beta-lactamase superfamily II)